MKNVKKLSAVFLAVCVALMVLFAPLTVSAAAPTAACTVAVTERNSGTDNYFVAAEVTFTSDSAFTAGLFTVEAEGLDLTGCEVSESVGGLAPELRFEASKNKVIFTGFSNSTEDDFRSYTTLTILLKFAVSGGSGEIAPGTTQKVAVKDIAIANIDEVIFTTPDAEGTLHIHSFSEDWSYDSTDHWHACSQCSATGDKAAHTFDTKVTAPTCTAAGYTTHTCSVCGYSYNDNEVAASGHTLGEWLANEDKHWRECANCHEIFDEADHTYEWVVTKEATEQENGLKEEICSVCGHKSGASEEIIFSAYVPGDINGDTAVNNKDLTRLFQYLSDWEVEVNEAALDVNGDGSVNNKDLTRLFQYLSDWDVEIH